MGERSGESCRLSAQTTEAGVEMPVHGKPGKNDEAVFPNLPTDLGNSIMPISTFPRHDNYEDQFLLKPAGLRDTHSEGKVTHRCLGVPCWKHKVDSIHRTGLPSI